MTLVEWDRDELAERVRAVVASALPARAAQEPAAAAAGSPLASQGLDSMAAARLWLEMREEFGLDLPLEWLARDATLDDLVSSAAQAHQPAPGAARSLPSSDPGARHEPFRVSAVQESYLIGRRPELTSDPVGCTQYLEFEVGALDVGKLRAAWQRLVEHHDMLRAVVDADGWQRIQAEPAPWTMRVLDLPAPDEDAGAAFAGVREAFLAPYQPGEWPMFRVAACQRRDGSGRVCLSIDALVADGWSLDLLLEQWSACYEDPGAVLAPVTLGARDCMRALCAERGTSEYSDDLAYWAARLRDLPVAPLALFDGTRADGPRESGSRRRAPLSAVLTPGTWAAVQACAGSAGVSPTSLMLTVLGRALEHAGLRAPVPVVVTTSRRLRLPGAAAAMVGPFTGTAVVPVAIRGRTLDDAAREVHAALWKALDHGRVSAVEAVRELRRQGHPQPDGALPIVFTSTVGGASPGTGGFGATLAYGVSQTSGIDLDAQVWERDGALHVRWDVVASRFPPGFPQTAFATFLNGLQATALRGEAGIPRELNELQQAYFVARSVLARVGDPPDPPAVLARGGEPVDGCQMTLSFEVPDFDVSRLESALAVVAAAYPALRTVVNAAGYLVTLPGTPARWHVPVINLSGVADQAGFLHRIRQDMTARPFPIGWWPPLDVRVTHTGLGPASIHVAADLMLFDAQSIHRLGREILRCYADRGASPALAEEVDVRLRHYAALRVDPRYRQWQEHWRQRAAELPTGPSAAKAANGRPGRDRMRLTGRLQLWPQLAAAARERDLSSDAVLLAAFTESLAQACDDRPFGITVVRWSSDDDRYRPGEFTELDWVTSPVTGVSLTERAAAYDRTLSSDVPLGVGGLAHVRKRAMREAGEFALPAVYTSIVDLSDHPLPAGIRAGPWLSATPGVALDCIGIVTDGVLELCWDAVAEDFPGVDLAGLFASYGRRLTALADDSKSWDRKEPAPGERLTAEQRYLVLEHWNDTAVDYPSDRLIHQLFEDQADRNPAALALRGPGWTRTYGELNTEANRVAWHLRSLGAGPGTVIGIRLPRGPSMIASVLGVLKAGAAYVPVEPGLPPARAGRMLAVAQASLLLTGPGVPAWQPDGVRCVDVHADLDHADPGDPPGNPAPAGTPSDTAYVIFTSGSTGQPKGVAVAHRPVLNLLNWCYRTFGFGDTDLGLAVTSLGFDLSVFDIFGLLGRGASVYLADEAQQRDPALLLDLLVREPITFWNSAPTTLGQVAAGLRRVAGMAGTENLRLVFLSGDYTPLSLPDELRAAFPRAQVVSLGGATEATVWSNYFVVGRVDPGWHSIPYGRPIDNARYYILDEWRQPCPPEVDGDLYIGGECLSAGYVNQPELTAERFLPDPFHAVPGGGKPAARMYQTGDRAAFSPDGTITFLGRADSQVKIRGFRVELGEVEHRLRQHPHVKDAVVLARADHSGERKLVGYLIARPGTAPAVKDVRAFAAEYLPDYMVPPFLCVVDSFPATANGKLDREALPRPPVRSAPAVALTTLRDEVAALFASALGQPAVDPDEDIWDQGATSFTLVQVSNVLQERYQQRIPLAAVLSEPTVTSIARHLLTSVQATAPPLPQKDSSALDFFSASDRAGFKAAHHGVRPTAAGEKVLSLGPVPIAAEYFAWRASCRRFEAGAVHSSALSHLLSLVRETTVSGTAKRLYPTAGDTYGVQVYLHVRDGGVDGLPAGTYYYHPVEHALHVLRQPSGITRSAHFYYNRSLFDEACFELYLIGQTQAVEPVYGAHGERYLLLEAGYLGQLLMMGQAACGIGLCPVGEVDVDQVSENLRLGPGHLFLHAFLGGPCAYPALGPGGERSPFSAARPASTPVAVHPSGHGPVIVGFAGRFPAAPDLATFWDNLVTGHNAIIPMPAARAAALAGPPGGYLDDIGGFDSLAFQIAPREAELLDPQLRLLFPVVWECLESAGYTTDSLRRVAGRVGVFVAVMWLDHQQVGADQWRRTGTPLGPAAGSDIADRISHFFGFQGPSVAVDTSCASGITALHLASESVMAGECGAAVVAAVNVIGHAYHLRVLSGLGLLAADGAPGAFDTAHPGWSPGEGAAAVLLRPADSSGEFVHGVVEGTWVGHAGRTSHFGAPNSEAFADSIRQALRRAGVRPADISYVECAAAGASVADAAEIEALSAVFKDRPADSPAVLVGTLKPNIGHLEAAAGLSQLTKVLLQMQHAEIAPTLLATGGHPLTDWDDMPLRPARGREPWSQHQRPLRALINAIGATGSYGHAVIRAPYAQR